MSQNSQHGASQQTESSHWWGLALIPPVVAVLVYLTGLPGDFVLDDVVLIENDKALQRLDPQRLLWDNYWGPARHDHQYRPFTLASYGLNYKLCADAWCFRLVNLLLHGLLSWLVFRLLVNLTGKGWLAALGASVFAVLPIHTEAVVGVVGRAELFAAIAVMLAWGIVLTQGHRGHRERWGLAAVVGALMFVGLGAKENTVVLLPVSLVSCVVLRHRFPWKYLIAMMAGLVLYLILRNAALEGDFDLTAQGQATLLTRVDNPLAFTDATTRVVNGVRLLGLYAAKTVLPVKLVADYSYDQTPVLALSQPVLWTQVLAVLGVSTVLVLVSWRRAPLVALGVLFFFVAFSVTCNVALPIGTIFGERLAYLPSVGFIVVLCGAAQWALTRRHVTVTVVTALLSLLVITYAARTAVRCRDWRSRDVLYLKTAVDSPRSVRAQLLAVGGLVHQASQADASSEKLRLYEQAHKSVNRALQIYPEYGRALGRRGELFLKQGFAAADEGESLEARRYYLQAEKVSTQALETLARQRQSEPIYLRMRAQARFELGKSKDAYTDMDAFIKTMDRRGASVAPRAYLERGAAAVALCKERIASEPEEMSFLLEVAVRDFQRALDHGEHRSEVFNQRGLARALKSELERRRGRAARSKDLLKRALADFDSAVEEGGEDAEIFNNRGFCHFLLGHLDEALEDYGRALEASRRKGLLYDPTGKKQSAWSFHRKRAEVFRLKGDAEAAGREEAAARALEQRTP